MGLPDIKFCTVFLYLKKIYENVNWLSMLNCLIKMIRTSNNCVLFHVKKWGCLLRNSWLWEFQKFWLANHLRKISGKMKLVSRGTLHNKKGSLDQNKQLLCHGEGPKNGVACYDIMAGKIRETFWNNGTSGKTIWSLDLAEKFAFQLLRFSTTLPTLKNGVATHKNGVA